MPAWSYFDASAIAKLATRELEADALETYIVGREALISSRLCEPEVFRAARRARSEAAAERAREALEALFLRDIDANVLRRAALVDPPELRTGDAIHLGTALAIGEPELEFVTYDDRLAKAASAAGLRVVQPGRDPHRPVRLHGPETRRGKGRTTGAPTR